MSHKFATYSCLVILREVKDLLFCRCVRQQVLRFAQDDNCVLRRELAKDDAKRIRTNSTTSGVT